MADWFLKVKKDFITCFLEKDRWHYILQGLGNTLKIALVAVLLGVVIGTVVAIIRSTYDKNAATMRPGIVRFLLGLGNAVCRIYLTVIRGTPVMIQILIMFFVIFSNARDGVPVAMLTFGINSARMWPRSSGAASWRWTRGRWRPDGLWASTSSRPCGTSSSPRLSRACSRPSPTSSSCF